jgi:translation initiation factor 2 beta subunit (eIF-2beta)/eIF-5
MIHMCSKGSRVVNDPSYRYMRHRVVVRCLSKKGGQTEISNFRQIVKDLTVKEADVNKMKLITEWITQRLLACLKRKYGSVQCRADGTLLIRGCIDVKELEDVVDQLVRSKLLCPGCDKPEWNPICLSCNACGFSAKPQKRVTQRTAKESCGPNLGTAHAVEAGKERKVKKSLEDNDDGDIGYGVEALIKKLDAFDQTTDAAMAQRVQNLLDRLWNCETHEALQDLTKDIGDACRFPLTPCAMMERAAST